MKITLPLRKKVYFASDFHLGGAKATQKERERIIVCWLDQLKEDAAYLFLVGDIFDFWFEYKMVIPKGFIRFQGKLAELVDRGVKVIFFTGNHDMWMFDYFTEELGISIFRKPQVFIINDKKIMVAHGDGLGPGDCHYKILKKIFRNKICQRLFAFLHPSVGMSIATTWAAHSWHKHLKKPEIYYGENEWIWQFAKKTQKKSHHDFYIFGHRHIPMDVPVDENSCYINLGEWINKQTYAVFDGQEMKLLHFSSTA